MATMIFDDASVVINSVDLSDHVKSVTISPSREMKDFTAMGNSTKANKAGMKDWSVEVEFYQDFAAAEVDATLWPLWDNGTEFAFVIKPTPAAVSATNPSYGANGLIESYPPIGGGVGDEATVSITIKPASTSNDLTRSTS